MLTSSIDVVALLGHASSELSISRREQLKPALKPECHALCSSDMISSPKFLFEEDLAKKVRDVKETHHLGNTVGSSKGHSRRYRHDSWSNKRESRNKGSSHARLPFLGKGTPPNSRKKTPYQKNSSPAGKKECTPLSKSNFR